MTSAQALDFRALVNPTPKQDDFLAAADQYEHVLYGGAKGGGKSYILRWWLVWKLLVYALQHGLRNVRVGLFCETYPELWDRHISKVRAGAFPGWLGEYHEQSHEFRLHEAYGGGVLCFRNLQDPNQYDGSEFAAMAIDEVCKIDEAIFHVLRSCKRWPGIAFNPIAMASNPQGKGLAWVRRYFIERDFSEAPEGLEPEAFSFVQAFARDNPHLPETYTKTLASLPENLKRAYLDGDWYVFEGQFFSEIRPSLHYVQPFAIPSHWTRWRSIDYGTTPLKRTYACLWWAQDPDSGRRYVYRELYLSGATARDQCHEILRLSGTEPIRYTLCDPAMFNKTNDTGTSPADTYRELGLVLYRASNDRPKGWERVREGLKIREDGLPGIQLFRTCTDLIRTLSTLVYSETNPEDLDDDGEDHLADALRYGCNRGELVSIQRGAQRPSGDPWGSPGPAEAPGLLAGGVR